MRIGLNLLYLLPGTVGGTETYAGGLLRGLSAIDHDDEFMVFVNRESADWALPESSNFQRSVCPIQAVSRFQRYKYEQTRLPLLAKKCGLQLMHSLGYIAPLILPCKSIVSILDIIYDYPGSYARRQLQKCLVWLSAHRASKILTISEHSKKQIVSRLHVSEEKIAVTYLAPKIRKESSNAIWDAIKKRLNLSDDYLLALSSFSTSKNIRRLIHAFAILKNCIPENIKLVLAGHTPNGGASLRMLVNQLELRNRVVFTGYLSDAELLLLFRHTMVFVFPSLYEGFGIPILEAMAQGIPVACSNAASMPEVAGEAALMFNPFSVEEIARSIEMLVKRPMLRYELIRKGYANAAKYSWIKTAENTLEVYKSAL